MMMNSQTRAWKTKFSDHALMRLDQRSKISNELFADFLDRDKAVDLGWEIMKSRLSRLFFSLSLRVVDASDLHHFA